MQLLSIPPKSDIDLSRVNLNKVDEPLVNVVEFSNGKIIADMQYIKQGIPGAIQTPYLRKEVAERLVFASSMLPNGYKLKIYDGWRPYEVQKYLYDEYFLRLKNNPEYAGASDEIIHSIAKKFVSFPKKGEELSYVHSSGGAVDLTIAKENGQELDMGCAFDCFYPIANTCALEGVDCVQAKNRRLLYTVMIKAGFTNYPEEWWHYDYGDLFWAGITGREVFYSSIYSIEQSVNKNNADKLFDVFISYRRDGGEVLGRLFFELLKNDYATFFDHESLSSGRFDERLLNIISNCNDFLVLLTPGCLDRCSNAGDWFMREISCALDNNKNVILLISEDFIMPSDEKLKELPPKIATLIKYHGYRVSVAYIDGVIQKIKGELRSKKLIKKDFLQDVKNWQSVADILSNPKSMPAISNQLKEDILFGVATAYLGEHNGAMLKDAIKKTFSKKSNFRTKYRYEIEISEEFSFNVVDISEKRYFQLAESLVFCKRFITESFHGDFWISFVANLDSLDDELKDENFFFSENLLIHSEDLLLLASLSQEEKREFYLNDMRVKININGKVLLPEEVIINESGVFGRYSFGEEDLQEALVKIRFKIPQEKANCYFFASINDPTYSPFIRFSYPEDVMNVKMIPFLSRAVTAKDTKVFDGLRELSVENEWVMPVSGAVFIIETELKK